MEIWSEQTWSVLGGGPLHGVADRVMLWAALCEVTPFRYCSVVLLIPLS